MSSESVIYETHYNNKTSEHAIYYDQTKQSLYRYLAYRDIHSLITKYVSGPDTLDYGCGPGISTRFLRDFGLNVSGIDVSKEMIELAQSFCANTKFQLVNNGLLPFNSSVFDFIFSSFVLFEIGTMEELLKYMKEARRVIKSNGIIMVITGTDDLYSKDWLCLKTDFPENKFLRSGDKAKIVVPEVNMEFTDYYWTENDIQQLFNLSKFKILETYYPLALKEEPYLWKDEKKFPPFVIYIIKPF